MNFDDLQAAWQQHPAAAVPPPRASASPAALRREVIRRRWRLRLAAVALPTGLILTQALFVVGYVSGQAPATALRLVSLILTQVTTALLFVAALRQLRRHAARVRQSALPLRESTAAALASIDAEIGDYRLGFRLLPLLVALPLLSAYANVPVHVVGWGPWLLRAGMVLGLLTPILLVGGRHYRRNLRPERERLRALLAELA